MDGYEADDIIGTMAKKAVANGFDVFMMTPDKDFGQLVEEKIKLYKPAYMGNSVDILGPKEVCEKWDIKNVSQVIDMLGLQGDTSDNIPGIPGVGPKTAAELLKQYETVENVIAHSSELKGKLKERVEEFGQQAILSKKLATIVLDVPIPYDEDAFRFTGPDKEALTPIFEEMEFKTMMPRAFALSVGGEGAVAVPQPVISTTGSQLSMFGGAVSEPSPTDRIAAGPVNYRIIEKAEERKSLLEKLKASKQFALEVLTDGAEHFDFAIRALILSVEAGEVSYLSVKGKEIAEFAEALANERIMKIGHNIKASILALTKVGIGVKGPLFDTMLAHYLIEPEASHDLGIIANQYLGFPLGADKSEIDQAMERVDIALQLKARLQKELETRKHSLLARDVEMPLAEVLACMEAEGVRVDEETLKP